MVQFGLACSRSALDDAWGQAIASGGHAATDTLPTALGGSYAEGGNLDQGCPGNVAFGGSNTQDGVGNIAGTSRGAAGAAPLCKVNDFFGERLVPTFDYLGGPPPQIVTTSDVSGDQWPDVVLLRNCFERDSWRRQGGIRKAAGLLGLVENETR